MSILKLLAGNGTVTAPTTPGPPTGLDTLRTVASGTRYSRLDTQPTVDTTYQATLTMQADAAGLQLVYAYPEAAGTGTLTMASALEIGGVLYPLTFGGAARATLTPAAKWVLSDTVNVTVAKGSSFKVRTFATAGSTLMRGGYAQNAGKTSTAGDLTVAGSGPLTYNAGISEPIVTPVAVRGMAQSTLVTVAGFGDSIMEGGTDSDAGTGVGGGFFDRAMRGAARPSIDFGIWADNFPANPSVDKRYGDNLTYVTHGVCEYGTNQMDAAGSGYGVIASSAVVFWNWVASKGVKLWQTTLIPRTTSTDNWVTEAGQTTRLNEASRVGFNDWVRDGAPILSSGTYAATGSNAAGTLRAGQAGHPLKGFIEVADTVETARNSGIWKVNGTAKFYANDGIHPAPGGHSAMAVPLQAWASGLTV